MRVTPNFELKVALLGNVSAGKSTVLNALLKDKYSEVAMKRTTAGVNYFRLYQRNRKEDDKVDCWQNLPDNPKTPEATLEEITTDNRIKLTSASDPTVLEKYFDVELEHNLVEMRADTQLVLVDIPGLNEAGTEHYKNFVNLHWHTFDCVVLIMDSKQGVNTQDQVFLLNLVKENVASIKKVPVIILCNKVDDPSDEELAILVEETQLAVEKIFAVGCRKKSLRSMLDKNYFSFGSGDASPAFIPVSAINAYIHQCASQMGLEKFKTFDKDLIEKLGREQLGRLRWNKLDDDEKIKQVFEIVSDPDECKEVFKESKFQTFVDTLECFLGGDRKQQALLYHQINTAATLLRTKQLKNGEISIQLWAMLTKWMKLHDNSKDFVIGTAPNIFWHRFSEWERVAHEEFTASWTIERPQCQVLARPMTELIGYYMFVHEANIVSNEKDRILANMKRLVCIYLNELLHRHASTPGAFENAIPIRNDEQLKALNPYDWSLLFRSVLLLARDETFCEEFGSQMILFQTHMPDSRGWLAANFKAEETMCHTCKCRMVANPTQSRQASNATESKSGVAMGNNVLLKPQAPASFAFSAPAGQPISGGFSFGSALPAAPPPPPLVPYLKHCPNGHSSPNKWSFFNDKGCIANNNVAVSGSSFGSSTTQGSSGYAGSSFGSSTTQGSSGYAKFPLECLKMTQSGSVPQYPEAYWKLIHISIPASISDSNHFAHLPWLYCQFIALLQGNGDLSESKRLQRFLASIGLEDLNLKVEPEVSTWTYSSMSPGDDISTPLVNSGKTSSDGSKEKELLQAFYREKNPSKIAVIDKLLKKYEGREKTMFLKLAAKYGVDPSYFETITS